MDQRLRAVLNDVTARAQRHDAGVQDRLQRWRVLEDPAGQLLAVLGRATGGRRIVEIGTSRGVSTLWLADAARALGARVVTVDPDTGAQREAAAHLERAGLAGHVDFQVGDGGRFLEASADGTVDVLFLDAERTEYPGWWPHPVRVLRPGGVLVADNAISHREEIAPFAALLECDPSMTVTTVDVGKGELIAVREPHA